MAVRFVLGRAGSGKTRHCIDAVAAALRDGPPHERLLLLVPEQAAFQMERALAERCESGGFVGASVMGFSRLAEQVFLETGKPPVVLSRGARTLALRAILDQDAELRRPFGKSATTPGFLRELERLIQELIQEAVPPQQLLRLTDDSDASRERLRAIAGVYERYIDWLGAARIDPAQRLAVLRERITQATWLRDARVWVDGFAGFTGEELATLLTIARHARELWITLLVDSRSVDTDRTGDATQHTLFHRTNQTYERLTRELSAARIDVGPPLRLDSDLPPRFRESPGLAAMESSLLGIDAHLGQVGHDAPHGSRVAPALRIVECETPREELRTAARWIHRKIRDSGSQLHLRDFAVICRDLEPLAATVREVFDEFELPCFLDRRRPVRAHALTRFITAILDALIHDFPSEAMARLPATGLLPMQRGTAEALDEFVVRRGVRGWAMWRLPFVGASDPVNHARHRVTEPMQAFAEIAASRRALTGGQWVRLLHATLESLAIGKRIERWASDAAFEKRFEEAETHRLAWESLIELLDDIDEVLGERPMSLSEFATLITSSLGDLSLGLAPPALDQVLVSSIERSRHPDIKFAWVLGVNDGVFPQRPSDELLLTEGDRQLLAAAGAATLRRREDHTLGERLLAYIAFTRPSERLVLSYSRTGDDGSARFPSLFVRDMQARFPELRIEQPSDPTPTSLRDFARAALAFARGQPDRGRAASEAIGRRATEHLCNADADKLRSLLAGTAYENQAEPIPEAIADENDTAWRGSPSEIERHLQCPFQWFGRHRLRLRDDREPRPLAVGVGELAHDLMARVTRRAIDDPRGPRDVPIAEWHAWLDDAVSATARELADLDDLRPREARQIRVLHHRLRDVLSVHVERMQRGSFVPIAVEQPFGDVEDATSWPAARIELDDGRFGEISGRVDRVDEARRGQKRFQIVYDYKPSPTSFHRPFTIGQPLQLLLYLHAIMQCADASVIRPAGVLVAPISIAGGDLKRAKSRDDSLVAQMAMRLPRGVFDETIADLLDADIGTVASVVVQVKRNKDGAFAKRQDSVPTAELDERIDTAVATARQAIAGIVRGDVSIAPLLLKRRLACNDCSYRSVCRYEPLMNRPRVAEAALPRLGTPERSDGDE